MCYIQCENIKKEKKKKKKVNTYNGFKNDSIPYSYVKNFVLSSVIVPNPMSMKKSQGSNLNQKGMFLVTLMSPRGIVKVRSRQQSIPQQLGGSSQFTMCLMPVGIYFLTSNRAGHATTIF